jgi:hypothetical protein
VRVTLVATVLSLLLAAAQPAPPAPQPAPEPPPRIEPAAPTPFVAPEIEYLRIGELDIGRWQYVNRPTPRNGDFAAAWRIDVFTSGFPTPRGRGAYSVTLYSFDCRKRSLRVVHAEMFDANRRSIDSYDGPTQYARVQPNGDEDLRQACGEITYDGQPLRGLSAVLADARGAAG